MGSILLGSLLHFVVVCPGLFGIIKNGGDVEL